MWENNSFYEVSGNFQVIIFLMERSLPHVSDCYRELANFREPRSEVRSVLEGLDKSAVPLATTREVQKYSIASTYLHRQVVQGSEANYRREHGSMGRPASLTS